MGAQVPGAQLCRTAGSSPADRARERAMNAERVRERLRSERGRSLAHPVGTLNPFLRGWINYFRPTRSEGTLMDLDGWVRRLRVVSAMAAVEAARTR